MTPTTEVSIILPCFNPTGNWLENIAGKYIALKQDIPLTELIIVNDGSTKNFDQGNIKDFFSSYPDVRIISYPANKGKGYALREGVKVANGKLHIYTDIDFPYTNDSLLNIYRALKKGNDVVVGIRNENYYTHLPRTRVIISKSLRFLIRKSLRIPTDDTQCGLKGFNQNGKEVFLKTTIDRYLFDLEFIFLAARKKSSIKTVEVNLRDGVELSSMHWQILLQEFGNFLKVFCAAIVN